MLSILPTHHRKYIVPCLTKSTCWVGYIHTWLREVLVVSFGNEMDFTTIWKYFLVFLKKGIKCNVNFRRNQHLEAMIIHENEKIADTLTHTFAWSPCNVIAYSKQTITDKVFLYCKIFSVLFSRDFTQSVIWN